MPQGKSGEARHPLSWLLLIGYGQKSHDVAQRPLLWHNSDMPPWSLYVRCWGQSGKHMLALSFSAFDRNRHLPGRFQCPFTRFVHSALGYCPEVTGTGEFGGCF
ncbi:hypothetical protein SAMN05443247_00418 [Bradyrhizobium erythrophlei]|jgi:hypothetical protein|nr:hypothetical protein SAMN05443247_00418 [Bradyrhizobium erythrophlei]